MALVVIYISNSSFKIVDGAIYIIKTVNWSKL